MGSCEFTGDFRKIRLICRGDVLNRPLRVVWKVFRGSRIAKFCNIPNFLVLFPIEAPADGLVPAVQELFPFFGLHFRLERHVAVPQALKLLAVCLLYTSDAADE